MVIRPRLSFYSIKNLFILIFSLFIKTWLEKTCSKNKWCHFQSPIIWRELVHRGSRGKLIGGVNEFLDYAETYYGLDAEFQTRDLFRIALENQREFQAKQKREQDNVKRLFLHRICVLNACKNTSVVVIFEALRNTVFGETMSIIIHLFCHPEHEDHLNEMRNDLFDLACPQLYEVKVFLDLDSALTKCDLILWFYDEATFFQSSTEISIDITPKRFDQKRHLINLPKKTNMVSENMRMRRQSMYQFLQASTVFPQQKTSIHRPSRAHNLLGMHGKSESSKISGMEIRVDYWKTKSRYEFSQVPKGLPPFFEQLYVEEIDEEEKSDNSIEAVWDSSGSKSFVDVSDSPKENELEMFIASFGQMFESIAKPDCTVIIYGHGNINYLAFLLSVVCKNQGDNIIAVDDTEVYAKCALAKKIGVKNTDISDVRIWGNPSTVLYVDISETTVDGYNGAIWKETGFKQKLTSIFWHWKWFKKDFNNDIKYSYQRQCEVKGSENVILPLAQRVVNIIRKWYQKAPDNKACATSIGIVSDGCYNIPQGFVVTCPVLINNQMWQPLPEIIITDEDTTLSPIIKKCLENQFSYLQKYESYAKLV